MIDDKRITNEEQEEEESPNEKEAGSGMSPLIHSLVSRGVFIIMFLVFYLVDSCSFSSFVYIMPHAAPCITPSYITC